MKNAWIPVRRTTRTAPAHLTRLAIAGSTLLLGACATVTTQEHRERIGERQHVETEQSRKLSSMAIDRAAVDPSGTLKIVVSGDYTVTYERATVWNKERVTTQKHTSGDPIVCPLAIADPILWFTDANPVNTCGGQDEESSEVVPVNGREVEGTRQADRRAPYDGPLEVSVNGGPAERLSATKGVAQLNLAPLADWTHASVTVKAQECSASLGITFPPGLPQDNRRPAKSGNLGDLQWLKGSAELGSSDAMNQVGLRYLAGEGVEKDEPQAAEWFRKAAEKANAAGAYNLAYSYAEGRGISQDRGQAAHWYTVAAELNDAAIQPVAFLQLGKLHRDGKGVAQDLTQARALFEKAAAQGNAEAALNLGDMYSAGVTVPADAAKAATFYKQAADGGDARAAFAYGFVLEHGQGVSRDDAAAARYYAAAARQNHALAENNLGMMYAQGRGVARDDEQALKLFQAAAAQGNASAAQNAQAMVPIVEQDRQLREAQRQAQVAQESAARGEQEQQERQERIAELQDEIQRLNQEAADDDEQAQQVSNMPNQCVNTGIYTAMCQSLNNGIGTMGAAKFRQEAAEARAEAQKDLEEMQRLSGMRVQHVTVDTSYAAALQAQVQQHPMPTIEDTLAQQQGNLYAIGAANDAARTQAAAARLAAANAQPIALQTSFASNGYSAGGSTFRQAGVVGGTQSNAGAASGSSSSGPAYLTPLAASCVRQYWDQQLYDWLAFENDCGQPVYLTFIFAHAKGWAMSGSMDLAVGAHDNTGRSKSDIDAAGGFELYVCPRNTVPTDLNGQGLNNTQVAQFRCKVQ
jgi:TPR repeat protein